ncbi:hypothetical protein DQB71_18620 [Klebsiella pneumoniae subsp. pneumoniae]|nr:hypothetical protein DQB71_18620 [Klebsiella pneumoniae subsp. pneumoniae]HBW1648593.1 transposase [Klebsiella pneumoniae]
MVGYHQTNQKTDTGKTLTRWPVFVDHFSSPESNGMAESFVKTMKRDYISIMPKPDGLTAAKNLAEAFEHYNEWALLNKSNFC